MQSEISYKAKLDEKTGCGHSTETWIDKGDVAYFAAKRVGR